MNAATHFLYNVIGAILWVFIFVFAGFFFGQIQVVQDNFSIVMIAILIITALPAIYALIRQRFFLLKKHQTVCLSKLLTQVSAAKKQR